MDWQEIMGLAALIRKTPIHVDSAARGLVKMPGTIGEIGKEEIEFWEIRE